MLVPFGPVVFVLLIVDVVTPGRTVTGPTGPGTEAVPEGNGVRIVSLKELGVKVGFRNPFWP